MLPIPSQYSTGLNFLWAIQQAKKQTGLGSNLGLRLNSGLRTELNAYTLIQKVVKMNRITRPVNFDTYYMASLIQDGNKSMIFLTVKK